LDFLPDLDKARWPWARRVAAWFAGKRLALVVEEQNRRMRSLYLISAATQSSGEQQIDAALKLVVDLLEMDYAYVGRIAGDTIVLESVIGVGAGVAGDVVPLSQTIVAETLARGDVVAIEDIASQPTRTGVPDFPGYHSYISAPLFIGGNAHGAIGFSSRRGRHFEEHDIDFIRLVAALVASAIERRTQAKRLDELAFYDALTGLPNRINLMQNLDAATARAKRHDGSFALHFIDLDGFKAVNDLGGHAVGDEVLVEVAQRLRAALRPYDVPSRLGGDEFVVLQAETVTLADVEALGNRIVDVLGAPIATSAGEIVIGASVGVAMFPADASDAATLLRRADRALYLAKARGKRRVEFYAERGRG
jgi:diguanylate cyclase (GGDEF)-like protein